MNFPRLLLAILLLLVLSGCATPVETDVDAIYTQGAQTMQAEMTSAVGGTAVVLLTAQALPATQPAGVPPPKNRPTDTPLPAAPQPTEPPATNAAPEPAVPSPAVPTATLPPLIAASATPAGDCLRLDWLGDVSVPPDTQFLAGSSLVKVWRVRNIGTCPWSRDFALAYTSGDLVSNTPLVFLPSSVAPGESIDIAVTLAAPFSPGVYSSSWLMRAPDGRLFGYGPAGSTPLPVRIRTYQIAAPVAYAFDLSLSACAGTWRSATTLLPCPGSLQDPSGSVQLVNAPTLENTPSRAYGLWMRPNPDRSGWISGELPFYTVQSGDHFLADVGCLAGSSGCDVLFEASYRTLDGLSGRLGSWRERYDGLVTSVDIDLSSLAGRALAITLSVSNRGAAGQADAVWLLPRVQQLIPASSYVLSWTRDGFPTGDACDFLSVTLSGPTSGVAVAYDCASGANIEMGRMALSSDQAGQLWQWLQRLQDSEGELYTVTDNHPVITWIDFRGVGRNIATNAELQAMNNLALAIWSNIRR